MNQRVPNKIADLLKKKISLMGTEAGTIDCNRWRYSLLFF